MKNKKLILALVALVAVIAVMAGVYMATRPETVEGAKTITVEVTAEEKTVVFTVKTDAATVGEALMSVNLLAGEEGPYGLYIKSVNGMIADFDVDQTYWAFNIGGEYAMTGVDQTEITEGTVYQLVRTK